MAVQQGSGKCEGTLKLTRPFPLLSFLAHALGSFMRRMVEYDVSYQIISLVFLANTAGCTSFFLLPVPSGPLSRSKTRPS